MRRLDDADRKRDRGAFFGSIHGTLNHLLWGDRMWLGRFIDEPCTAPAFGAAMFADFEALARERELTDMTMLDWAGGVTPEWLAGTIVYTSKVDGKTRELPRVVAAVHLFNHGTHHRGQLTTLLKQAGPRSRCHRPAVAARPRPRPRRARRMKKAPGEERPGGFRFACQRGGGDGFYRMNARSAAANLERFGKTCAMSVGLAPNHLAERRAVLVDRSRRNPAALAARVVGAARA